MRTQSAVLIFLLIAWSTVASAQSATDQAVKFADLQGATIEVSAVQQQRIKRDGQIRSRERRTSGQVKIGPGDAIATTFTNTNVRNGQAHAGEPRSGRFTLGQERKAGFDDDVIWQFTDNSLIRLQAFGGGGAGGHKMIIAFQRSPNGLQCSFTMNFASEEGKETIQTRSRQRETMVEILESKQVSSTCRIVK